MVCSAIPVPDVRQGTLIPCSEITRLSGDGEVETRTSRRGLVMPRHRVSIQRTAQMRSQFLRRRGGIAGDWMDRGTNDTGGIGDDKLLLTQVLRAHAGHHCDPSEVPAAGHF